MKGVGGFEGEQFMWARKGVNPYGWGCNRLNGIEMDATFVLSGRRLVVSIYEN